MEWGKRIYIADDEFVVREGLARSIGALWDDKVQIIGEATSVLDVNNFCRNYIGPDPDVGIFDVNMPGPMDGESAAQTFRERFPRAKVVSLTARASMGRSNITWGDYNLSKGTELTDFEKVITQALGL